MSKNYTFPSLTPRASERPRTRRGHQSADNEPVATASPSRRFSMPTRTTSSTSSPTEGDSKTPEGSPSRVANVQTTGNQTPLPSLVPKSESGIFVNNSHIPSRLRVGATMGRLSLTDDTSSSDDDFYDAYHTMLPPMAEQPNSRASAVNTTAISILGQRYGHQRNKTTISNISEMLPLNPQVPSLMEPLERFNFDQPISSGRHDTKNFAIEQKHVLPSVSSSTLGQQPDHLGDILSRTPEPMHSPTAMRWKDSARNEDIIPDSSRARTLSGVSIDSTSTIADDTWNPVDTYLSSSSSDGELNMGQAVPLHAMNNERAVPGLWDEVRENPEEIPTEQLDYCYPLDEWDQAGHQHAVECCDFAYVARKVPSSAEEWDNVELVRKGRASDEASLADTIDMSEEEVVDQRALDLARREIYHDHDREETILLGSGPIETDDWVDFEDHEVIAEHPSSHTDRFLLPSTFYVPPEAGRSSSEGEARTGLEERFSFPNDGALRTLPSTVYVQPTPRLIAEDAGSIMEYASGSGSDGDDEASMRIDLAPVTRIENNTVKSHAEADNGDSEFEEGSPINSKDHTSMPSIKLQKTRKAGGEKQRRHSANVFRRISARLPGWGGSPHIVYSFQSPPQGDASQRVVSEPLLSGGVDVPVQDRKRDTSFARLLNKFKSKDGVKKANDGTAPPKSLLRRAVERADEFIVRHNW
ncbi:hypothetical protein HBH70_023120 [Parastagonospora nodorum]|nr:hypothetical protein HBH53_008270 [Parastagonospora nodorum]KAH4103517.1 hypothetical protein HBH46_109520 [Parastagonospora nodorum]KAH4138194.1 hypothetical protein HBH45_110050 [Parastagonospora nodorum]KAH4153935.1 hypothetical protein HBH44_148260 [Parastagonospora nodorum]KAH4198492.1 hypothetical protein HBH42_045030 [Parastagonospora nodorum]